ncbi:unnamed protein product [Trichogramma brassicae]|uniref:Uncharacterized protein n=1 Tax=Trichogramma brassicae TaxID=86971 RepID=A0A6H5IRS9_9HYME|nr:unnamed protein product [Trichogramma brassicae]
MQNCLFIFKNFYISKLAMERRSDKRRASPNENYHQLRKSSTEEKKARRTSFYVRELP